MQNDFYQDQDRISISDKEITRDLMKDDLKLHLYKRISAKKIRFEAVDFSYTIFDNCYFRNCVFDSCKFIGCKFLHSNLEGSDFIGCSFEYAFFEKTNIEEIILNTNCPSYENLKLKFARTLRTNYASLGNTEAVNKAIIVELNATKVHLKKSWKSNESYYRSKYSGIKRLQKYLEWLRFKIHEFVWGNGESIWKLVRTVFIIIFVMMLYDTFLFRDYSKISSYWYSLISMPEIFFSISKPTEYSDGYLSLIYFMRLLFFGLFMTVIIKRLGKR